MLNRELESVVSMLLWLDSPSNYDCPDSACESITDSLELSEGEHNEVCEVITEWYERNE